MFQTFVSVFEFARDLYHGSIIVWCIVVFVACLVVNGPLVSYLYDLFDNDFIDWYYCKVASWMIIEGDEPFQDKIIKMIIRIIFSAIETPILVFILIPLIWEFIQVIAGFITGYIFGFFA